MKQRKNLKAKHVGGKQRRVDVSRPDGAVRKKRAAKPGDTDFGAEIVERPILFLLYTFAVLGAMWGLKILFT